MFPSAWRLTCIYFVVLILTVSETHAPRVCFRGVTSVLISNLCIRIGGIFLCTYTDHFIIHCLRIYEITVLIWDPSMLHTAQTQLMIDNDCGWICKLGQLLFYECSGYGLTEYAATVPRQDLHEVVICRLRVTAILFLTSA